MTDKRPVFKWQKVHVPVEYVELVKNRIRELEYDLVKAMYPHQIAMLHTLMEINSAILERMEPAPWLRITEVPKPNIKEINAEYN